jgi:hypothetical protein
MGARTRTHAHALAQALLGQVTGPAGAVLWAYLATDVAGTSTAVADALAQLAAALGDAALAAPPAQLAHWRTVAAARLPPSGVPTALAPQWARIMAAAAPDRKRARKP